MATKKLGVPAQPPHGLYASLNPDVYSSRGVLEPSDVTTSCHVLCPEGLLVLPFGCVCPLIWLGLG